MSGDEHVFTINGSAIFLRTRLDLSSTHFRYHEVICPTGWARTCGQAACRQAVATTAGHRQTRRDSRSTRQRGSGKVCESGGNFGCAHCACECQNSAALAQVIYTKHSFDQELLFRPSFASFPKPNTSRIHSSSKQRCRAGIMIDLNASERDRLSPQQR